MLDNLWLFRSPPLAARPDRSINVQKRLAPVLNLLLSRLLQGIIVLLIVSMLTFALLAATGGDALTTLRNDPSVKEETIERLRQTYGLEQPLAIRYTHWLGGVVRGDLGESYSIRAPVWKII